MSSYGRFILRRVLVVFPVLIGIITISFLISRIIPGNPAAVAAGPSASQATIDAIRHEFGLDDPWYVQYGQFWNGLLHGDLGRSILTGRSVTDDLARYFPATLELTLFGLILGSVIGVAFGVIAAKRVGTWTDRFLQIFAMTSIGVPQFWLALVLQIVASMAGILPVTGRLGTFTNPPPQVTGLYTIDALIAGQFDVFAEALVHLFLPGVALAAILVGIVMRVTRANMLDVLSRDYITNAQAAGGLPPTLILYKYALKNAMIPVISTIGLNFGYLLSGSLLVETVFNWAGTGLYTTQAAIAQDFQPILGGVLLAGGAYVILNLLTDISYGFLDPRIRKEAV
jgi:peptide/nickel transport system permease protein